MYSLSTWSCPSSSQAQIPGERRPGQGSAEPTRRPPQAALMRLPRARQSKPRMTALRRTHHRAAVADQPAGDGDQPPPQGCDHGLAAAHAVSCQDVHADSGAGELVQPGGHVRGEQRSPHPGQVYLGVSRREVPEGGAELAVAEDVFHRGAVPSRRRSPRYRPVQGTAGPAGADRERDLLLMGGAGQLPGEVPGVAAQRQPPGPRRRGQAGQRAAQQPGAVARGSSVPSPRSAASTTSASAQVATCARPTRCP
jgi:hypothetical protein